MTNIIYIYRRLQQRMVELQSARNKLRAEFSPLRNRLLSMQIELREIDGEIEYLKKKIRVVQGLQDNMDSE